MNELTEQQAQEQAKEEGADKKLSHEDISGLLDNPSSEKKIEVIEKLSSQYNANGFSESQIMLAEQIFRILIKQAEVEVKKALSENLMNSTMVPHDVVLSLARDVEEVSLPVLEFSEVLTDDDLIEIINSTEKIVAQVAIANRSVVSESVSEILVEKSEEEVVGTLMNNDGAKISEKSYEKVINNFSENERIVESMVTRGSLSGKIIQHMTATVSNSIREKIETKYESSFTEISTFFQESGEVAALKFIGKQKVDKDLMKMVDDLEAKGELIKSLDPVHGALSQLLDGLDQLGQLTPLSALIMGHKTLFEINISRLTGVPYTNIRKLVSDREGGLNALYARAQLPPRLFEAVQFVVGIIDMMDEEAEETGGTRAKDDLTLFMKKIIQESSGQHIPNLSHVISVISSRIEDQMGEW